jgi:hypothetical protein
VHDDGQEGLIDLEAAVVFDEPELLELVHEEVHARARRADHFRERLLRDPRQHAMGLVGLAVPREQQQRAGQPLLAGIEQLIDQVCFDATVPSQHVRDEPVRKGVLIVEQTNHLLFRDDQHRRRGHGRRGLQANGMTRQRAFTEEVPRPEHRHDRLFAGVRLHRKFDRALLNVQDAVGCLALGENDVAGLIGHDGFPHPCGTEKRVRVERRRLLDLHDRWIASIIAPAADGVAELRMWCPDRRFDHAFVSAGLCSRRMADPMADILQRADDPGVAPRGILLGHPHHQALDLQEHTRTTAAPFRVRPLAGDELPVPPKYRVGRDDRRDRGEATTAQPLSVPRQPPAFFNG